MRSKLLQKLMNFQDPAKDWPLRHIGGINKHIENEQAKMLSSVMLTWNWNVEFNVVNCNVQLFFFPNTMLSSLKLKWRIVKGKVIVVVKLKWKMLKCLMSNVVVIMIVPQICYKSSPQIISYIFEVWKKFELGNRRKRRFGFWKRFEHGDNKRRFLNNCVFC